MKATEIHFDGEVVSLIARSTVEHPEQVPKWKEWAKAVGKRPEVEATAHYDGQGTLHYKVRLGPPGWRDRERKAQEVPAAVPPKGKVERANDAAKQAFDEATGKPATESTAGAEEGQGSEGSEATS